MSLQLNQVSYLMNVELRNRTANCDQIKPNITGRN
jgi:hypothetical protein